MSRLHLIFGLIVFVVFAVTGKFMRIDFPDKDAIPPELRMLMRSRHIYILFSALLHILLGLYFQTGQTARQKYPQLFGSLLLFASSVFLVWAFVRESYTTGHFSEISRLGIYLSLAGVSFHLLARLAAKFK